MQLNLFVFVLSVLGLSAASPVKLLNIADTPDAVVVESRHIKPEEVVRPINNMVNRLVNISNNYMVNYHIYKVLKKISYSSHKFFFWQLKII